MTFLEMARNPRQLTYRDWKETRDELGRRAMQGKAVAEILALLEGFEAYDPEPGLSLGKSVGDVTWEDHSAGPQMRGFVEGMEVGWIFKHETHKPANGPHGVYEVSVLGEALSDRFHGIAEAREAGSRLYAARSGERT